MPISLASQPILFVSTPAGITFDMRSTRRIIALRGSLPHRKRSPHPIAAVFLRLQFIHGRVRG